MTNSSNINNLETFCLIWLDSSVNNSEDNVHTQQELRGSINYLRTFEQIDQCEQFICSLSTQDRVVMIVSGQLGRQFIPHIHQLRQIVSIYIYCKNKKSNEQWTKDLPKVKGVIVQLDELVARIRSDHSGRIQKTINEPLAINIFNASIGLEQSTTKLNGQFLYSQLLLDCLLRMEPTVADRNELIFVCQKEYQGNQAELNILHQFEETYSANHALWWYTRESFVYRLVNKALRIQNSDLLFLFRFFIRDLQQQLEAYRCSSPIRVYRGQLMSNDELQVLNDSVGKFISVNSFLSTSLDRQLALFFLDNPTSSDDMKRVLFEIDANPQLDGIKPFANITSYSYFAGEEEVLLMSGSIFRVENIRCDENQLWLIRMTLCSDNDHDLKSIFCHMRNRYGEQKADLLSFGHILRDMGKFDDAEKYYRRLLNEPPIDNENIARCYHALGIVAHDKGDYASSLEWHQKSLQINERILQSNDLNLANSYNSIGMVYEKKGDYDQALESFNKSLAIWTETLGNDHPKVAMCLNNMAGIYQAEKNYLEALKYNKKALSIRLKHLPADHPDLGASHSNIGIICRYLDDYDRALEHDNMALQIYRKSLPPQHPQIAATYNNLGLVYEDKEDWKQALTCYKKAATIYRYALPRSHPYNIKTEKLIRRVSPQVN